MFSRVRIAIRFFFVGLAVGILMAPRSGEQTRRMLRAKADELLNNILDAASMGAEPTSSSEPEPQPRSRTSRSGNGSGRSSRTTKAADVAEEAASEAGI